MAGDVIMRNFITFDLNGWFDHFLPVEGEAKPLGNRSCLYNYDNSAWLVGNQALSLARNRHSSKGLIDAYTALEYSAGLGHCSEEDRHALPKTLWQLVKDTAKLEVQPPHLAVVIPDGRLLGTLELENGKTKLDRFYETLFTSRPNNIRRSRLELIWRSVATLKAIMDKGLIHGTGFVFVINVNRTLSWTVLEICNWPRDNPNGPRSIVRRPIMDDCDADESWTQKRLDEAKNTINQMGQYNVDEIQSLSRMLDIMATGMSPNSWEKYGIDVNELEFRSWPTASGDWEIIPEIPRVNFGKSVLSKKLTEHICKFVNGEEGKPLGVVIESPVGTEMTDDMAKLVKQIAKSLAIWRVSGSDVINASRTLAQELGQNHDKPAWLDEVPAIDLNVRKEDDLDWQVIIPKNKAVPAGNTYRSQPNKEHHVEIAAGVEHVHLHFRRRTYNEFNEWEERYSSIETGHTIIPSDHVRHANALVRVRPLSGEARIEIIEHCPDGTTEAIASTRKGVKWSEMSSEKPEALRSIPDLYIFKASPIAWKELKFVLEKFKVIRPRIIDNMILKLNKEIYKCTQKQWRDGQFPLGSDGQPPRSSTPENHEYDMKLLRHATNILVKNLEYYNQSGSDDFELKVGEINRLHLALTWLFTGCPDDVVDILVKALKEPEGKYGSKLKMDNKFSEWAIYSGFGRTVRRKEHLRFAFDHLLGKWENKGAREQDKYLLAAITHPMARRVEVRHVLNEDKDRFDRVKAFLDQQLINCLDKQNDSRPSRSPSLEIRYIVMGYRGLCQIRYKNPDWLPVEGKEIRDTYDSLIKAKKFARVFEKDLIDKSAPFLIGEGEDPTMPSTF